MDMRGYINMKKQKLLLDHSFGGLSPPIKPRPVI